MFLKPIDLTEGGHLINGMLCQPLTLLGTQPLFTYKTYSMMGKGSPSFRRLWAGCVPNSCSGGLSEGIAFLIYKIGSDTLIEKGRHLSNSQNIALSLLSGAFGAPINALLEQGMIRQQLHGKSLYYHMNTIFQTSGWKGLFKTTGFTAGRDGLFICGVFAFYDLARERVKLCISDPWVCNVAAGMLAGMTAGALSTPFDLVKTIVQSDTTEENTSCLRTLRAIVEKGGMSAAFRGGVFRSLTIGPVICLTAILKDILPHYFPSSLRMV